MAESPQANAKALAKLTEPRPDDVPKVIKALEKIADRAAKLPPQGAEDGGTGAFGPQIGRERQRDG